MKFKLVFIRHGKSESNKLKVMSGHFDTPLSQEGKEELKQLREQIVYPETDMYFSSDLSRAKETFEVLYYPKKLDDTIPQFRETNFGPFEQQLVSETIELFYETFFNNVQFKDAENYTMLKERVSSGILEVIKRLRENKKSSATVVCHNGVIRMIHHLMSDSLIEKYRDIMTANGHGLIVDVEVNDANEFVSKNLSFFPDEQS